MYFKARLTQYNERDMALSYIAEGVKIISSNTAKANGGMELRKSLSEVLTERQQPEDTRSAEEIQEQITAKWKKLMGGED